VTACVCSEKAQPLPTGLAAGANSRPRQWFVTQRNESISAFNGYKRAWSDFSWIHCRVCGAHWKTKASFVGDLPNCEFFPARNPPVVEPIS
jgi:hypothetical protein